MNHGILLENGDETLKWRAEGTGKIESIVDSRGIGNVIRLSATDLTTLFAFSREDGNAWRVPGYNGLSYEMKSGGTMGFFGATIETDHGIKVLLYSKGAKRSMSGNVLTIPLEGELTDRSWHRFTVDFERDLKSFIPAAHLEMRGLFRQPIFS